MSNPQQVPLAGYTKAAVTSMTMAWLIPGTSNEATTNWSGHFIHFLQDQAHEYPLPFIWAHMYGTVGLSLVLLSRTHFIYTVGIGSLHIGNQEQMDQSGCNMRFMTCYGWLRRRHEIHKSMEL